MPCYRPVTAWKPDDGGPLVFREMKNTRELQLSCGQCIGCRIAKRDEWATRIYAEAKLHRDNKFVTFTYAPEFLPHGGSLVYRHIQLLHKKMRKEYGPFRFFVAGEYGDEGQRPHYHAIYFGLDFPDMDLCNSVYSQHKLFRSPMLEKLWGRGSTTIGEVTYESAQYCATYTTKRITGEAADTHYSRIDNSTGEIVQVEPEFARMSLKPGIGEGFVRKFHSEIYTSGHNAVHIGRRKRTVPHYFDTVMEKMNPDTMEAIKHIRQKEAQNRSDDNTRERLAVREICAQARVNLKKEKRRQYDL